MINYGSDIKVQEQWYERLHDWEKALESYVVKQASSPDDFELTIGQMRCLEALAEWGNLEEVARSQWNKASDKDKNKMAPMAGKLLYTLTREPF